MTAAPYPAFDGTQVCAQADPEAYFPPDKHPTAETEAAKKLCTGSNRVEPCDFRDACLDYALTHKVVGVWGGTSNKQRDRIRRKRGIVAVPMEVTDTVLRLERMRALHASGLSMPEIAEAVGVQTRSASRAINAHRDAS